MSSHREPVSERAASERLRELMEERSYVRVLRTPTFSDDLDGFVAGVGARWVLLQTTRDGGYGDGWNAFRLADVHRLRVQDDSFQRRVGEQQPAWPPAPPFPIDLSRTEDLLHSVEQEPLIGIEKEWRRSALWVGRVRAVRDGRLRLHEIDPQGRWHEDDARHRLRRVSRVQVRSEYLRGLASVAPAPAALA